MARDASTTCGTTSGRYHDAVVSKYHAHPVNFRAELSVHERRHTLRFDHDEVFSRRIPERNKEIDVLLVGVQIHWMLGVRKPKVG
jgi:hypothetical protein